ncbi:MAG TPA: phosphate ABC transporter substrate-binding protein PstS [Vicinamibacterales bacterium]|nr:phosphate ABC transporter substrate-binding protein PstS [Vicinamibacterales bacterium]
MKGLMPGDVKRSSHWTAMAGLIVCAAVTFSGCSVGAVPAKSNMKPKPTVPDGGILLQGAGATFPAVLYDDWFRHYQNAHPLSVITYDAVGSGEGVRRFIGRAATEDERIDFGASDAAMRDDEIAAVPNGALLLPLTAGSVALAYNLPDVPALKLSRRAYAAIFLGLVKSWNDPLIARSNPGVKLPNLTIATVVRQDASGTTFAFTKHLDAISDQWRSQYGPATLVDWPGTAMRASGNEGVASRIKGSIGSIGYVSYEFAVRAGLTTALVENHAGNYVAPGPQSSMSALADAQLPDNMRLYVSDPERSDAYPIVTLTWVLLYKHYDDAKKAKALDDLFTWCLTEGQGFVAQLGYTPLPEPIQHRALAALGTIATPQ